MEEGEELEEAILIALVKKPDGSRPLNVACAKKFTNEGRHIMASRAADHF